MRCNRVTGGVGLLYNVQIRLVQLRAGPTAGNAKNTAPGILWMGNLGNLVPAQYYPRCIFSDWRMYNYRTRGRVKVGLAGSFFHAVTAIDDWKITLQQTRRHRS